MFSLISVNPGPGIFWCRRNTTIRIRVPRSFPPKGGKKFQKGGKKGGTKQHFIQKKQ
jgi:hypothetical protein